MLLTLDLLCRETNKQICLSANPVLAKKTSLSFFPVKMEDTHKDWIKEVNLACCAYRELYAWHQESFNKPNSVHLSTAQFCLKMSKIKQERVSSTSIDNLTRTHAHNKEKISEPYLNIIISSVSARCQTATTRERTSLARR